MGRTPETEDELPEAVKPYRFHGAFERNGPYLKSNRDFVGTCPFCGKEKSFMVHGETGQFTCHSKPSRCGRSGNIPSFLQQFSEEAAAGMNSLAWRKLVQRRGGQIPAEAFRRHNVGYDPGLKRFLVPNYGAKGTVDDIRVYTTSGRKMGTAGIPAKCWNLHVAKKFKDPEEATIFICEGEWDGMPFDWLLSKCKIDFPFVVVGLPGARTVKDDWVSVFMKFGRVVVMGDNDGDGDAMAEKIWRKLMGQTYKGEIHYLNWPDTLVDGWDVGDQISKGLEAGKPPRKIWRVLKKLIDAKHRRMPFKGQENVDVAKSGVREQTVEREKENPTFEETVDVYASEIQMTDSHTLALQFCFSVYLATQWDDDPLWGFLCGVSGFGKSLILCSLDGCPESIFYSSMQSKALVSGFKFDPDPSLIPEMIGRCAIFKDWTELLTGNQFALEETYGTLRGWYDGYVKRKFGNGVEREYFGRGNILAGVTNLIHGINESVVGDRFLKFQFPKPTIKERDNLVMAAMMATAQEKERTEKLQQAAYKFLNRDVPPMNPADVIPMDYLKRIRALASLVEVLRAKVQYTGVGFDRELSIRPDTALPTRLGKCLVKLAMANCVVLGKPKVNRNVFRLVERVAFNTAYGFHLDLIQAMMNLGGKSIVIDDLAEVSRMPRNTMAKRIIDLEVMGVVNKATFKRGIQGRPAGKYTVAPSIRKLWDQAAVEDDHIREMAEARRPSKRLGESWQ
jgi:hypothetical protein